MWDLLLSGFVAAQKKRKFLRESHLRVVGPAFFEGRRNLLSVQEYVMPVFFFVNDRCYTHCVCQYV